MESKFVKDGSEATMTTNEFWENELEMGLEPILPVIKEPGYMEAWLSRLTGRQVNVLRSIIGASGKASARKGKDDLRSFPDELIPYVLVDNFAKYKSKAAVFDFAKGTLKQEILDTCEVKDGEYDKTALLFALYHLTPKNLRLIFHLDKVHKTGFARMNR